MRTLRLLAAWSWLRWRARGHTLDRGRRAGFARASAWLGLALSVLLGLALGVVATGLAIGAWFAGRDLAAGNAGSPALLAIRIAGATFVVLFVVLALLHGGRGLASGWTRLLLLPVSRREIHLLELLAHASEPWLLVIAPALVVLPLAVARAGAAAALLAAVAGLLLYTLLATLAALLSFGVQLLLRDRRRAELVVLVSMLAVMAMSVVPGMLLDPAGGERQPRGEGRAGRPTPRLVVMVRPWLRVLPSEAYAQGVAAAARGETRRAAAPLAVLGAAAAACYGLSLLAWRRLVDSPAVGSRRRRTLTLPRLPRRRGLADAARAVGRVLVTTTLRTVQGRISVVTPLLLGVTFAVLRGTLVDPFGGSGPAGALAGRLGSTGLLALGPISVAVFHALLLNQFGVDGGGLSRQLLCPLGERSLLAGKLLGGGALCGIALLPAMAALALLRPTSEPLLWPATLFAGAAAYLFYAPVGIWLSLLFPKAADLSSMGSGGKPHTAAALSGLVATVVVLLVVQGTGALAALAGGAAGALLAEALLALVAAAFCGLLLRLAAPALAARRDALLLALRAD